MTLYQVKEVIFIWLPQLPLSRQISSSSSAFPWRTARNDPSNIGRKTVYTTGCSVLSLVNCGPSVPSTIKNCVSKGMSRPDEPILCVIHHILNRKVHMNRWSLQHNHCVTSVFLFWFFSFSSWTKFFFFCTQYLLFAFPTLVSFGKKLVSSNQW